VARRNKQPTRAFDPHPQRARAMSAAQDWDGRPPTWSFSRFDFDGPWGCGPVDGSALEQILRRLSDFESMTWAEMRLGKHPPAKPIPIQHLCAQAQARLAEIRQDDFDALWELHVAGLPRLWGIRTQAVFNLLWFDLDHAVCPSHLRHT
jgi:hypothetical protein